MAGFHPTPQQSFGQGSRVRAMNDINDYIELVKAPWGRIFYDLLFEQLAIPQAPRLKILDFGSGLGVTANHFAAWHDVTVIEPNSEMIEHRYADNHYTQILGGIEETATYGDGAFDMILCHNVLEYMEEKEPIIAAFFRMLKPGGTLSIVKHNRAGRVIHTAVFRNNPAKAAKLIDHRANDVNQYLGTQYLYSLSDVRAWADKYGGKISKILGMRAFWALGQDNTIKYSDEWYRGMLDLERRAADIDEYKNAAFYNHILIEKTE